MWEIEHWIIWIEISILVCDLRLIDPVSVSGTVYFTDTAAEIEECSLLEIIKNYRSELKYVFIVSKKKMCPITGIDSIYLTPFDLHLLFSAKWRKKISLTYSTKYIYPSFFRTNVDKGEGGVNCVNTDDMSSPSSYLPNFSDTEHNFVLHVHVQRGSDIFL